MKNKRYIKEDAQNKGYDPYEPTSEKISKNLRGLSLKLGQIFDSVKEGDTLTAMTEMTNFKSMTDSVLKQMASFYDDSPAEPTDTMVDGASPEGAIPIGEAINKKKKLPYAGIHPANDDTSKDFFNHQSQGNGQTQNITNTADAVSESFKVLDEQLWDSTVMLKNELTGKMEECKVFTSLDNFNRWADEL